MREIKFRGKPVYRGGKAISWVYGTFRYIPCNVISPGATDNGRRELRNDKGIITEPLYGSEFEVLCDTVGQYTGLKDKNGKEIYEGDIFVRDSNMMASNSPYCVRYKHGSWIGVDANSGWLTLVEEADEPYRDDLFYIEIIGNIHDNPELLKEG